MVPRPDGGPDPAEDPAEDLADVLNHLRAKSQTLAVAESLTGGLLAASLTSVAGSSAVFRGSLVAYASDLKVALLGVAAELVERVGVVSPEVAEAMAAGARAQCGATWALSTTGVAGPDQQEGKPVGTVFVGWAGPEGSGSDRLELRGDRAAIRRATCVGALSLLRRRLEAAEQPIGQAGEEQSVPGQG